MQGPICTSRVELNGHKSCFSEGVIDFGDTLDVFFESNGNANRYPFSVLNWASGSVSLIAGFLIDIEEALLNNCENFSARFRLHVEEKLS